MKEDPDSGDSPLKKWTAVAVMTVVLALMLLGKPFAGHFGCMWSMYQLSQDVSMLVPKHRKFLKPLSR
jgi:hypothetical protein